MLIAVPDLRRGVLERYVGPDFDVPTVFKLSEAYESNRLFNNPCAGSPFLIMNQDIRAGTGIDSNLTMLLIHEMRWIEKQKIRMGALIGMTFLAQLPKESTKSKILQWREPDFSARTLGISKCPTVWSTS